MPQLKELYKQIEELDPVEREQLAFTLSEEMFPFHPLAIKWFQRQHASEHPSIVASPTVCGGAARLVRTRIPVWTIERMTQLGFSDLDILRSYPTLRADDLVQARSYVASHRDEIEKALRENEEE